MIITNMRNFAYFVFASHIYQYYKSNMIFLASYIAILAIFKRLLDIYTYLIYAYLFHLFRNTNINAIYINESFQC